LIEEGIEPDAARRAAASARVLVAGDADEYTVWASFSGLPMRADFESVEPSDLPSIVGAICGASGAPHHWTARLNNTLKSQIIDYHPIFISECASRALDVVKTIHKY